MLLSTFLALHLAPASLTNLDAAYANAASDIKSGQPLVIHAHVPLCDNRVIPCGNSRLGNGDDPDRNLYWGTSGGFKGWFKRSRHWKQVAIFKKPGGEILRRKIWKARISPNRRWKKHGVSKSFDVYLVADAWRGTSILQAMKQYANDLAGDKTTRVQLPNGTTLHAGGGAHLVAYVGHNGWMDYPKFRWPKATSRRHKATIAVACLTKSYLKRHVSELPTTPLLMTTSLLFAGAHAFEGAAYGFAQGRDMRAILSAAVNNYSHGQGKSKRRVRAAFTNPSDKKWN